MTQLKFDAKVSASAAEALEPHTRPVYENPGARRLFIGEFAHTERTQPAPGSEKEPTAKVRITHLEIPNQDQEGYVREALRFLHLQRTARGTLDDDGQLELDEHTLRLTGGQLAYIETARLKAGLSQWASYARRALHASDLTVSEIHHELKTIADGLTATLSGVREDGGE
ncbi:hypothetical protein OG393_30750 [Streptomyces sp. NBC_01216]|uniref:hypothetical protein n=1 Tax=Streptomyces sp. NBC_01216 TaxID=2903778 RepID=UPI002E127EFB|nr:hypothetical protein OG393_30750 [Streptomyces sp. NBC_01216]